MSLLIESLDDNVDIIDMNVDEQNDMTFNVYVEGVRGKISCRLMIETFENGGHVFAGSIDKDLARFSIEKNTFKPGKYPAQLEIFAEDRYFVPIKFYVDITTPPNVIVTKPVIEQKTTKKTIVSASLADRYKNKRIDKVTSNVRKS